MWQAQKEDRKIHILATIPFVSADVATRPAREINQAYDASAVIIFESDPDVERRKAGQQVIMQAARYPEGDSLVNHLSDNTRKQYRSVCQRLTINTENLDRVRPWMAAQNLLKIAMTHSGVRLGDNLDMLFYRRAVNDDKPMAFLNNAQATIDLYSAMSDRAQERVLEKALRDSSTLTNFLPAIETAWRASDAEGAQKLIHSSFAGFEDVAAHLFSARNSSWADDLDAQAGIEGEVMALINLSQLVGPENLFVHLKNRGYLIAQVVPE